MRLCTFGLILSLLFFVTLLTVTVEVAGSELVFGSDGQGEYAIYTIKKGESLWSTVVPKYTDRIDGPSIKEAVNIILKRNNISDATKIRVGQKLKIPIEILSAQHLPPDMLPRLQYEQKQRDLQRYNYPSKKKKLSRAVIIIDPGHGGVDTGARGKGETYEDELVYDIMCRLKRMLERETGAKVYVTMRDKSRGFMERDNDHCPKDQDEYIQTTPSYKRAQFR